MKNGGLILIVNIFLKKYEINKKIVSFNKGDIFNNWATMVE